MLHTYPYIEYYICALEHEIDRTKCGTSSACVCVCMQDIEGIWEVYTTHLGEEHLEKERHIFSNILDNVQLDVVHKYVCSFLC